MKQCRFRQGLAALLAVLMLPVAGLGGTVSADVVEKPVATFSASDGTTQELLYGTTFYTNWKTADGYPGNTETGKGVDVSGSATNGAHKKMYLKTTLTLTALAEDVDVATCWKQIAFHLRSANADNQEQATNRYYLAPTDVALTDGRADISIPLTEFQKGNIDWTDVRQLNILCELQDAYHLGANGTSNKLRFTLENTRIVRELADGEVDKDELQDLVNATIVEDDFTAESVAVYNQAVEAGRLLLADDTATQEQVDTAAAAIKSAKKNLVSSAEVYKGRLQELLSETVAGDDLTAYNNAKAAAQPLMEKEEATQKEINDAVLNIVREKLAVINKPNPSDPYSTRATFSASNQSWSYLQGGQSFYTDWKRMDGAGTLDASGTANNGAHRYYYLQMQIAFTALAEGIDPTLSWKQIGVRLRGSSQAYEAGFFYMEPAHVINLGDGYYTVRVPLRSMSTNNIDWADVQQLNVIAELNTDYRLVDEEGNAHAGESQTVGFTMGQVGIVEKIVWAKGDVNNQDGVTAEDALLALQSATKKVSLLPLAADAAEVDGTAGITAGDALMILQHATKKIDSLEEEEKKLVAFTFDDGPGEYTEAFLDGLKERGVSVTFFVKGNQVEQYPELVTRMAEDGHAVGNHSYSHPHLPNLSDAAMKEEIDKCNDLIEQYTGQKPTLFRGPGFAVDDRVIAHLKEEDMRLINCAKSGHDWDQTDKDVIVNFFMQDGQCTIVDGDIVLLHEVNEPSTFAALELIDMLLAEGYEFVTVQQLLDIRADGGQAGVKYERVVSME